MAQLALSIALEVETSAKLKPFAEATEDPEEGDCVPDGLEEPGVTESITAPRAAMGIVGCGTCALSFCVSSLFWAITAANVDCTLVAISALAVMVGP